MTACPASITRGSDPFGRDSTVVLADGRVVSSWSEDWRVECFDRHRHALEILKMRDKPARQLRLAQLGASRGAEYRRRLEAAILARWQAARATVSA